MRSRVLAVLALTATATLGTVSAQPANAGSSPFTGSPATSVATQARPVAPPAFRTAVRSAAAAHARGAAGALGAAGSRSIGNGVTTDLPTRVELGADLVRVPYSITVPTGSVKDPGVEIALVVGSGSDGGQIVLDSFTVGTSGQTTFRGALTVPTNAIDEFGDAQWIVAYGSVSGTSAKAAATDTVVKIRSLLGEAVTRNGDSIRVTGAAKIFAGQGQYIARPGTRVGIDRYAGNGTYVRLATVYTDRLGHLDVTVRIPYKVGIRLTTADTDEVFGAVTPTLPI